MASCWILGHEVEYIFEDIGPSIQEWTKWNLWKTAFKDLKLYGLLKQTIITKHFLKAVFHKFNLIHSWVLCPIYHFELYIN